MPKKSSSTPITSLKHTDKRANIPTEELRGFMDDDEKQPKTLLYPRDPSLDPQLVWKGKDEQDRHPLEVPAVPVYIQEKIQPQAIIESLRANAARSASGDPLAEQAAAYQLSLFNDFNNIQFEDLVDFYHHEQNWTNRMILGDSLLVMTSLAEKEGLKGKVQMIYLDPPYGIKFGSNWQVSTKRRDVKDGREEDLTRQPEQIKAFRDTWELGIHSYLSYLRDRLVVARELLNESGSVFVQIGDENVHMVRSILDEIFGSENYCNEIVFRKTTGKSSGLLDTTFDILLWYAKNKETTKYRPLFQKRIRNEEVNLRFIKLETGEWQRMTQEEFDGITDLPKNCKVFRPNPLTSTRPPQKGDVRDYRFKSKLYSSGGRTFSTDIEGLMHLDKAERLFPIGMSLNYIRYLDDFAYKSYNNIWDDTRTGGFSADDKIYVVQTVSKVIERCLLLTTDPGDLVLDPTCGSGTTAYVAEQWGRRWITLDTSRVAIALARTRLMSAKFPYYLLADSPEGILRQSEINAQLPPQPLPSTAGDIKKGFIYRRVPHVTLKSIANNEEIDAIHAHWQAQMEPLRAELNRVLGQSWEEWQIPRDLPPSLVGAHGGAPSHGGAPNLGDALRLHAEWQRLRRERQKEIDASIARRADTELLYDQPYEENKKIRVTGPFTVESLSPHRVLALDAERPASEVEGRRASAGAQFEAMILENLKAAGVQNTRRGERLKFDRLETFAGAWIHAAGEFTHEDGQTRRVAVCIGPEHGTVGPELIREAAIEAVQGMGFDLLVVCGFAFDPHVSEEVKRYGKLTILPARMNPDLAMGDALLKKTGAGNLFMVFGEPDIAVKTLEAGRLSVSIQGVDIYDPTTGEIRSSSTDEIACWFIDTNYDGQSFFVRHAYFTGAGEPYEDFKRALRAEIDEAAWSALYSTTSVPFDKPKTGKIAIKVINHYGDEAMQVYTI